VQCAACSVKCAEATHTVSYMRHCTGRGKARGRSRASSQARGLGVVRQRPPPGRLGTVTTSTTCAARPSRAPAAPPAPLLLLPWTPQPRLGRSSSRRRPPPPSLPGWRRATAAAADRQSSRAAPAWPALRRRHMSSSRASSNRCTPKHNSRIMRLCNSTTVQQYNTTILRYHDRQLRNSTRGGHLHLIFRMQACPIARDGIRVRVRLACFEGGSPGGGAGARGKGEGAAGILPLAGAGHGAAACAPTGRWPGCRPDAEAASLRRQEGGKNKRKRDPIHLLLSPLVRPTSSAPHYLLGAPKEPNTLTNIFTAGTFTTITITDRDNRNNSANTISPGSSPCFSVSRLYAEVPSSQARMRQHCCARGSSSIKSQASCCEGAAGGRPRGGAPPCTRG